MMTITTSSSSKVKPLDLSIGPPLSSLLVDAELNRRRARLVRADVRRPGLVVEVRQPQRRAVARARGIELVHAARTDLPAVARRVRRRADDAVSLIAGDGHVAVVEVVIEVIAAARRTDRAPPRLEDVEDVVTAHRVGKRRVLPRS